MKLTSVAIKHFRSVHSADFVIDESIIALVGGNESGKSNILRAIKSFYDFQLPLDVDDKHQLSSDVPKVTAEFTGSVLNTEFAEIFAGESVEKVTVMRSADSYFVLEPQLNETVIARLNPELNKQQNEIPVDVDVLTKLFSGLPKLVFLSSAENDYLKGKNIPIADLKTNISAANGTFKTLWDFLAIGDIHDCAPLENPNLDQRIKFFNRVSSVIGNKINSAWAQEDIKVRLIPADGTLCIHFRDGKNFNKDDDTSWIWACPEDRSNGFQWYISFYSRFLGGTQGETSNSIILLDDPGLPLNALAQRDLVDLFVKLSETNQIVYTSHSPYLIDWEFPKRVKLIEKNHETNKGTTIRSDWSHRLKDLPEPLRSIGYSYAGQILNLKNVIVEGATDKYIINQINDLFRNNGLQKIELEHYRVVDAGCASETVSLANFATKTEGLKVLVILDKDQEGINTKQKADQAGLNAKYITEAFATRTTKQTIEDLLPFDKYLTAVNISQRKFYSNWIDITKEDFNSRYTPVVAKLDEIIKSKLNLDDDHPLKKFLVAQEYIQNHIDVSDFVNSENQLNPDGNTFAELFKLINENLK